jgi:hypothetical protein
VADLDSKYRPQFEALLEPGEGLDGLLIASQQKGMFKGGAAAIGVTDRRLLFCELDRRGHPQGAPRTILPADLLDADAGGAGGGWPTVSSAIMDRQAVRLTLKLRDGEKLKLMLMRGEGSALGRLGGGEVQRQGVEALAGWFRRLDETG